MTRTAVEVSNVPLDLASDTHGPVAGEETFANRSPEAALDHAVIGLLDAARQAAETAALRRDEIDAILAEIRALRRERGAAVRAD